MNFFNVLLPISSKLAILKCSLLSVYLSVSAQITQSCYNSRDKQMCRVTASEVFI